MHFLYFSDNEQPHFHPLQHKNLVFTGALTTMTRSQAAKRVQPFQVNLQSKVTPETDFVILGDKRRGISTKQRQAKQLIELGHDIQLLEEDDFLWLLSIEFP